MEVGRNVRINFYDEKNPIRKLKNDIWSLVAPFVMLRDAHEPFNIRPSVTNAIINQDLENFFNEL